MRRARASRLYCNSSFVQYSINSVASHYSCDTVTFGPRSEPAIPYSARIFKQVQPVVITTQRHLHSNLAIGYDSQKVLPSPPTQAVYVCYYEESDFLKFIILLYGQLEFLPIMYGLSLLYYFSIILLYYYVCNSCCWRPICESHCVRRKIYPDLPRIEWYWMILNFFLLYFNIYSSIDAKNTTKKASY